MIKALIRRVASIRNEKISNGNNNNSANEHINNNSNDNNKNLTY